MPTGKVIDPDGQQASEKWGYILRFDGPTWPGNKKKVIPFLNDGNFSLEEEVNFKIDKIDVADPNTGVTGRLAIATSVVKKPK